MEIRPFCVPMNSPQQLVWGLRAEDAGMARSVDEIATSVQNMARVSVQAFDQLAQKVEQTQRAMNTAAASTTQVTAAERAAQQIVTIQERAAQQIAVIQERATAQAALNMQKAVADQELAAQRSAAAQELVAQKAAVAVEQAALAQTAAQERTAQQMTLVQERAAQQVAVIQERVAAQAATTAQKAALAQEEATQKTVAAAERAAQQIALVQERGAQQQILATQKAEAAQELAAQRIQASQEAAAQRAAATQEAAAQRAASASQKAQELAPLRDTQAQTTLVNLGRQADSVQAQLRQLGEAHPQLELRDNFQDAIARIDALQVQLKELEGQPHSLQLRVETAQAQQELAQLQRATADIGGEFKKSASDSATFVSRVAGIATGLAVYQGFAVLQTAISGATKAFIEAPAAMEQYLATYSHVLGSMDAAKQRVSAITDFSIFSSQTREQIVAMDSLLAANQFQAEKYGRTIKQVWQDIADAAASRAGVPGADVTNIAEIVNTAAQGDLGRAFLRLRETGLIGKEDMERQGITFEEGTNRIKATSDQFLTALFAAWEQKFGGLDRVQATTFNGILSNMQDFGAKAAEALGKDTFAGIRQSAQDLFATLNDPKNIEGLEKVGHRIGEIADIIGNAASTAGKLWQLPGMAEQLAKQQGDDTGAAVLKFANPAEWLGNVGSAVGDTIDHVAGAVGTKIPDAYAAASQAAQNYGVVADLAHAAASRAANQNQQSVDLLTGALANLKSTVSAGQMAEQAVLLPLQEQMDSISRTARDRARAYDDLLRPLQDQQSAIQAQAAASTAAFDAQIQPLQDHLAGIQNTAEAIRTKYDALIQPLKDQGTELDRVYQKQQQINQLNNLDRNIRRDSILAQDLYSSEGRAAAQRLGDEQTQRGNLVGTMQHDDQKNALADQVQALERARDAQTQAVQADAQRTQAQITDLERARTRQAAFYKSEEDALGNQIKQIGRARDDQARVFQDLTQGIQDKVHDIESLFKRTELGAQIVEAQMQAQIDAMGKQQAIAQASGITAISTVNTISTQVLTTIQRVSAILHADIPTGNRDFTLPSYGGNTPPAAGGSSSSTGGYTPPIVGATQWLWNQIFGGGKAAGGPVSAGRVYEVNEPGGAGHEFFIPSMDGMIAPSGAGGSGGGTTHLHVTWSFDGSGQPVIRDVVRSELNNPANARLLNRTASNRGR